MFRFFRKIRQGLLAENRVSKYFLYAAGEIALVVIGILLAFQIDTWGKKNQDNRAAIEFYKNTKQQLLSDRGNIEGQIDYNARYREAYVFAINAITSGDRSHRDSLSVLATTLADYSDFDRQGNIYESMVTSGDIKLLKNDDIKNRLRQLEETYIYLNRMESIHLDFIMELMPKLLETVKLSDGKVVLEDELYGASFQNFFSISLRISGEKEEVYYRAIEEIDGILELVSAEIEK